MRCRGVLLAACLAGAVLGCTSGADEAAQAAAEGQAALDRGDIDAARVALTRAVNANDGSAQVWAALGRAHLAAGDYGGAFHAYGRASELDQGNTEALQALADLSLMRGQARDAQRYADDLELLQPGSPGPVTTKGFVALLRSRPDDALQAADAVLAKLPYDPAGSILKARALDAKGASADGARLLEAQIEARGPSKPVLENLLRIYRKMDHGPGLLETRRRLSSLAPDDRAATLAYAGELYRAGQNEAGRRLTTQLAARGAAPAQLSEILTLWRSHEPPAQAQQNARAILPGASLPARVAIGRFLVDLGEGAQAEALLRPHAGPPVRPDNADAVAVFAHAQVEQGRVAQALPLLNEVLAFDPTNIAGLRARTDAHLALGRTDAALTDARRLVDESPSDPDDRVRLAASYLARGQRAQAESVYWRAFNEIPGNPDLYRAFRSFLARSGQGETIAVLERRYAEQQTTLRNRGA